MAENETTHLLVVSDKGLPVGDDPTLDVAPRSLRGRPGRELKRLADELGGGRREHLGVPVDVGLRRDGDISAMLWNGVSSTPRFRA